MWNAFWKGGPAEGSEPDERTPEIASLPGEPRGVVAASLWGMTFPWTLVASTALGIWMMFVPGLLALQGLPSDAAHLSGALIVVVSVVAMAEPLRALRFLNGVLALVIAASPWVAEGASGTARVNGLVIGLAIVAMTLPRGAKSEEYGSWDRLVF